MNRRQSIGVAKEKLIGQVDDPVGYMEAEADFIENEYDCVTEVEVKEKHGVQEIQLNVEIVDSDTYDEIEEDLKKLLKDIEIGRI